MLRHAIAPLGRYTKASHDVERHPRLNSDAKILLLYVQGLPEDQTGKALSDHARKVGITGSAYKTAKKQLVTHGFVHDLKEPVGRGRWVTVHVCSNVPLTSEDVAGMRGEPSPGVRFPAVGEPSGRAVGGLLPVDEELDKNSPHPPPEAEAEAEAETGAEVRAKVGAGSDSDPSAEVVQGERVLLSLRHERRDLYLGVREARGACGGRG
ncbi:hypothetical protein ABT115_24100 [Streptomyces sp. NPDC001832]|uniref:hypothetical protein n=1 Tax=Streptomyces sp. NPDC001832 TaxID=3154527 RepID=UPI0033252B5E